MADSLLPGDDLAGIQGLLNSFQPSQADKDAARRQAQMQFFLGLLGAPKGGEFGAIRNSGLLAMQGYNSALENQQKQLMERMQTANAAIQAQNAYQQYKDSLGARQVLQGFYAGQGIPGAGQPPTGQPPMPSFGMNDRSMGSAPAPMASPASAPMAAPQIGPAQAAPGGIPPKTALYKQYEAISQALAAKGLPVQAQQYADMAQKYRPKLFKTEEGTDPTTGERVQVNYYDDGTHEILRDVGAQKKEAKQVDTGSVIGFVDPFTGQPIAGGGLYNRTMTPGETASNQIARANLGISQQRLGIERENQDIKRAEIDPLGFLGINTKGVAAQPQGQRVEYSPTLSPSELAAAQADARKSGYTQPNATPIAGAIAGDLHGDEFLGKLPPALAAQVKGLSQGEIPFPSSFALKSPYWQGMINLITQYDPSFDAVNYQARAATRKDFTSGKSAQSVNAINTTIGHLADLDKSAQALNNTNFPMLNSVVNAVGGQVSPDLKGRLNTFNTQVQAVASEMERVYRQAGGSTRDIEEWKRNLSSADSPEAVRAGIKAGIALLNSKLSALSDQYNKGMGTTKDGLEMLSPKSQAIVGRLTGDQSASGPIKITGDADYAKLPSGTVFVGPDGVQRRKP